MAKERKGRRRKGETERGKVEMKKEKGKGKCMERSTSPEKNISSYGFGYVVPKNSNW